jgi:hypothetical protein
MEHLLSLLSSIENEGWELVNATDTAISFGLDNIIRDRELYKFDDTGEALSTAETDKRMERHVYRDEKIFYFKRKKNNS